MTLPDVPAPADITGSVLAVLALLVAITSGILSIVRTRDRGPGRSVPTPASALETNPGNHGPIWARVDEIAGELGEYRERVARDYATRTDLAAALELLSDIDRRSRRTETILETVFAKALKRGAPE